MRPVRAWDGIFDPASQSKVPMTTGGGENVSPTFTQIVINPLILAIGLLTIQCELQEVYLIFYFKKIFPCVCLPKHLPLVSVSLLLDCLRERPHL